MSHVVKIETKIIDLNALRSAVIAMGFEWLQDQKTYAWYGTWIGDTPMPADMKKEDLGKCEHAIRVPGASYTVGVVRSGAGYELRYDYWMEGGLEPVLGRAAGPLVQAYAVQKTLQEARVSGRNVLNQRKLANGSIEILLAGR